MMKFCKSVTAEKFYCGKHYQDFKMTECFKLEIQTFLDTVALIIINNDIITGQIKCDINL